jgi:hypothetical protein
MPSVLLNSACTEHVRKDHVRINLARTLSLAGLLAVSALLSACGGGGGAPATTTVVNNPSTPTGNTSTGTTTTSTTSTSTVTSTTGTMTGQGTPPDSSFYEAAPNNTCANAQENKFPDNTTDVTLAEFEFSGMALDGTVGDGTITVVKTNEPQAEFGKSGPYYKRKIRTTELVEGLAIDPNSATQSRLNTKIEHAYYSLSNSGLVSQRFGLVGINEFLIVDELNPVTTTVYMPTFYDRIFALAPGQSMLQSETSTATSNDGDTQSLVITKRINYIGIETFTVNNRPIVTCKYEVRKLAPQDNMVTTEWYLKGTGTIYKSSTVNALGKAVRDVRLVRYRLNETALFPI